MFGHGYTFNPFVSILSTLNHYRLNPNNPPLQPFLSITHPLLVAEIINTFQNQELQLKWQNLQSKLLSQQQTRITQDQLRSLEIDQQFTKWKTHNEKVQSQLNDKIDSLRDKFADVNVALEHDLKNLEKRFGQSVPKVR